MRRQLLLLAAIPLMLILALPAAAAAGSAYPVKNAAGHKVGSIFPQGSQGYWALIRATSGKKVGDVENMDGYWVDCLPTERSMLVNLTHTGSSVWSVSRNGSYTGPYPGRAKHIGSRWILQKKVNGTWKKRGSVSGSCRGQFAAGALRSLLWR